MTVCRTPEVEITSGLRENSKLAAKSGLDDLGEAVNLG